MGAQEDRSVPMASQSGVVAPANYRSIEAEGLSPRDAEQEKKQGHHSGERAIVSKAATVVLGPDGKPCRACNSKLAFAAAMKGAKQPSSTKTGTSSGAVKAGAGAALAASSLSPDSDAPQESSLPSGWRGAGSICLDLLALGRCLLSGRPSAQQRHRCSLCSARSLTSIRATRARSSGRRVQARENGRWLGRSAACGCPRRCARVRHCANGYAASTTKSISVSASHFSHARSKLAERWLDGPADGSCD